MAQAGLECVMAVRFVNFLKPKCSITPTTSPDKISLAEMYNVSRSIVKRVQYQYFLEELDM